MEKSKHPCGVTSCKNLTTDKYCEEHKDRETVRGRRINPERVKMYKDPRYQRDRERFLIMHPFCNAPGCNEPATDLDHIIPHRGDFRLFYDMSNWQGLCHKHHSIKTATEDGGFGNRRGGRGKLF